MGKKSAGILLYRGDKIRREVFLIHPGGPYYSAKDQGVWSIPKGEFNEETAEDAARREFKEETGRDIHSELQFMGTAKMSSGKLIYAFAAAEDFNEIEFISNHFEMEWPPKSGLIKSFPEADRCGWFDLATARQKIHPVQLVFIDAVESKGV